MAEVQQKESGDGKKGKPKKMHIHVDFTPMVDMNMLLITFFMLCTTMRKTQTMEINMPSNDKNIKEEDQNKVADDQAITILLGENDIVYYYEGFPDNEDYTKLKETTFKPDGLRAYLQGKNSKIVKELQTLRAERDAEGSTMSDSIYKERQKEIKAGSDEDVVKPPVVIIKGGDGSTYKNLIDALDEMNLCGISKYAVVDIERIDSFLIDNLKAQGSIDYEAYMSRE